MKTKFFFFSTVILVALAIGLVFTLPTKAAIQPLTPIEELGKFLFFDKNLSSTHTQACAACHAPQVGWTGPDEIINAHGAVYEGAVSGRFGNRKPPAAAYAGFSPILHFDAEADTWVGGMFWDGRATGDFLGDPLAEQAQGPFLNPLEMDVSSAQVLCQLVAASAYADQFEQVWGASSLDCVNRVTTVYEEIGRSIAAYERSKEVSASTSKFDFFWNKAEARGLDITQITMDNWNKYLGLGLNGKEVRGLALFNTKAKCSGCHVISDGPGGTPPLFTDYTYDNLGIPRNPENPFYSETEWNPLGEAWIDYGLGGYLKGAGYDESIYSSETGKFKVPTLRNVDLRPYKSFVKAYGHNGYFKSLSEIVHFYNTRDVAAWPPPEYAGNINTTEVGDLGLTAKEEQMIVLFLNTLSDGYKK